MKKVLILIVVFLCIPFLSVDATPPIELGVKLEIASKDCQNGYFSKGHIDLLVLKEEVGERLLSSVSENYTYHYGHIESIEYLTSYSDTWVSYHAFVEDAIIDHVGYCNMQFMLGDELMHFSSFKLIYFDDEGKTLYESNTIQTKESFETEEYIDVNITFDADEPYHIDVTYENVKKSYVLIFVIIAVTLIAKYGFVFFSSLAALIIIYALIRVVIIQIKRKNSIK